MRKICLAAATIICIASAYANNEINAALKGNLGYVNVFIGTEGKGHTSPAVWVPNSMVQPGPDTGNASWEHCSGYQYTDKKIDFFTQNRNSGGGSTGYGDVGFIPFVGNNEKKSYSSSFDKESEFARPGYYKVYLEDAKCNVEITASQFVAFYNMSFQEDDGSLYFDFQRGLTHHVRDRVKSYDINKEDDYTIVGHQLLAGDRNLYFAIKFEKPIKEIIDLPRPEGHIAPKQAVKFGLKKGEDLKVKIALSFVSKDGAKLNLTNLQTWDFNQAKKDAYLAWDKALSLIDIEAPKNMKTIFYTALYHTLIQPTIYSDIDGKYRAPNGEIKESPFKEYYGNFPFWDTYRCVNALYTIITPHMIDKYINSCLMFYEAAGNLPVQAGPTRQGYSMVGENCMNVIGEMVAKGFTGFDWNKALDAMVDSSSQNRLVENMEDWEDRDMYEKYGYYPYDLVKVESVARTLECSFNDHNVALVADKLGKKDVYDRFYKRSRSFENVFDKETQFMRGKDSNGNWREPFSATDVSHVVYYMGDYTEGNAWQYTWLVLHDPEWLINAFGGDEPFVAKLFEHFTTDLKATVPYENKHAVSDATGMIGMAAMGNEPSFHVPYLFTLANRQDLAARFIRQTCDQFFKNEPEGLSGNDDLGSMSASYVFACLGFYPVNPSSCEYVFGAPQVKSATINLPNGKQFKMIAHNLNMENRYVKSIKLNGQPYSKKTISHSDIINGATLEFYMTH